MYTGHEHTKQQLCSLSDTRLKAAFKSFKNLKLGDALILLFSGILTPSPETKCQVNIITVVTLIMKACYFDYMNYIFQNSSQGIHFVY